MTRSALLIAALLLGLAGPMVGCKNACDKAKDKIVGCMEDFCAENEDSPACSDEAREAGMARLEENFPEDCSGDVEAQSNAALELTCEQLIGGILNR